MLTEQTQPSEKPTNPKQLSWVVYNTLLLMSIWDEYGISYYGSHDLYNNG